MVNIVNKFTSGYLIFLSWNGKEEIGAGLHLSGADCFQPVAFSVAVFSSVDESCYLSDQDFFDALLTLLYILCCDIFGQHPLLKPTALWTRCTYCCVVQREFQVCNEKYEWLEIQPTFVLLLGICSNFLLILKKILSSWEVFVSVSGEWTETPADQF